MDRRDARAAATCHCRFPDCGPAAKDWHLIAGISRSEKIPENGPKIEI